MAKGTLISRRKLIQAAALIVGQASIADPVLRACGVTPKQTEGPFYPVSEQLDENNDLTSVDPGSGKRAKGQIVYVTGTILDENCRPIPKALVEIWQAAASGRYNHPGDAESQLPLDPNFQHWGRAVTSSKGRYLFKTVIPGQYEAEPGWIRPPHIHFKVFARGFFDLTTQMYFSGNPLNDKDRILLNTPLAERGRVIVDFKAGAAEHEAGSKVGVFDIVLKKV